MEKILDVRLIILVALLGTLGLSAYRPDFQPVAKDIIVLVVGGCFGYLTPKIDGQPPTKK